MKSLLTRLLRIHLVIMMTTTGSLLSSLAFSPPSYRHASLARLVVVTPRLHHDSNRPKTLSLEVATSSEDVQEDSQEVFSQEGSLSSHSWDNFDYKAHWYPVIWVHELRLQEPTKVTVFDVDYMVAKINEEQVIGMVDRCPHKAAALSQGRLTASNKFQCAYHGWSFDGTTGECVEIPQIVDNQGQMPPTVPSKSCGKAIPAMVHQNMVWLFPGGGWEEALMAPPPPTVQEVHTLDFQMTTAMRDMPVDWPIVMSNICDPDHGLFAHQAAPFDMYSASQQHPLQVQESFPHQGKGYRLETQVEATEKLLAVDKGLRAADQPPARTFFMGTMISRSDQEDVSSSQPPTASSYLEFPTHLQLKRIDKATNSTSFVSAFYICPVGVGRTRFMSAGLSKKPPKNWMTKLFLDNFLDQDTYLLATQQQYILQQEAHDIKKMMQDETNKSMEELQKMKMPTRKSLFCLSSPTDKMGAKMEQFWDATLMRVPNRNARLLQLDAAGAFMTTPSREFVLDRKAQHLDITPSAQAVVANCDTIIARSKWFGVALIAAKVISRSLCQASKWNTILKPWVVLLGTGMATLASWFAQKVKAEYYFKYTDERRRKDLSKIPTKIWTDK